MVDASLGDGAVLNGCHDGIESLDEVLRTQHDVNACLNATNGSLGTRVLLGDGFQDYLSKFRVRHFIQNAPQYRSMEKEEIAERCGFNDAKTLDKYLKQMFSISLSEYLKLMSRGESPT